MKFKVTRLIIKGIVSKEFLCELKGVGIFRQFLRRRPQVNEQIKTNWEWNEQKLQNKIYWIYQVAQKPARV